MSARGAEESWQGTPLPRGRHKLPPDAVRASQRERLLRAMLELVGEHGYAATTVPAVVAAARVSRNSFYELFDDKLDCFLALCDETARDMFDAVVASAAEPGWRDAVLRGTEAYLEYWRARPAFSRAYFSELPSAGPAAVAQRERASQTFRELFEALSARARVEEPDLPPAQELGPRLLVGGITEIVAAEVRAGRTARLPELRDSMAATIAAVIAGRP